LLSDAESKPPHSHASGEQPISLPPASFSFLVLSLRAQAEMQLGLIHFGDGEKHEP
jgi:hypothetical protein